VPRCDGAQLRRCGRPAADLLRISGANVKDAPNDKLDRKPQPRVTTADRDAGLVFNRESSTDSALRPDRLRTDSHAENPWLSAPVQFYRN
jgi:hypothetical protein